MKAYGLVLSALLLFASGRPALAVSHAEAWNALSQGGKESVIVGVSTGMYVSYISLAGPNYDMPELLAPNERAILESLQDEQEFIRAKSFDIVLSLNSFYNDARNRNAPLPIAVHYCFLNITGETKKANDYMETYWRPHHEL